METIHSHGILAVIVVSGSTGGSGDIAVLDRAKFLLDDFE
jgi:hypothetical protein